VARVLRGDTHFPGKVVSLFEAQNEIIRKGKLAKRTEFGRLVKIQEAEAQFITDYEVCERGQPGARPLGARAGSSHGPLRPPSISGGRRRRLRLARKRARGAGPRDPPRRVATSVA
jgi:hypothetical protein